MERRPKSRSVARRHTWHSTCCSGTLKLIESEAPAHLLLLLGFTTAACRPTGCNLANLLRIERDLARTDFEASADECEVMELCVTVLNQLRWLATVGLMTRPMSRTGFGGLRPALVEVLQTLGSRFDVSLAVGAVPLADEIPG